MDEGGVWGRGGHVDLSHLSRDVHFEGMDIFCFRLSSEKVRIARAKTPTESGRELCLTKKQFSRSSRTFLLIPFKLIM